MVEFGSYPKEVERAAKERDFGIKTGQPDTAHRLEPDLIECGSEIVWPRPRTKLAKAVGVGHREFALGAKGGDRVAQLLDLAKAEFVIADACQQHLDPGIARGGLDPVEHIAQCWFGTDQKPQQAVFMRTLGEPLGEVDI